MPKNRTTKRKPSPPKEDDAGATGISSAPQHPLLLRLKEFAQSNNLHRKELLNAIAEAGNQIFKTGKSREIFQGQEIHRAGKEVPKGRHAGRMGGTSGKKSSKQYLPYSSRRILGLLEYKGPSHKLKLCLADIQVIDRMIKNGGDKVGLAGVTFLREMTAAELIFSQLGSRDRLHIFIGSRQISDHLRSHTSIRAWDVRAANQFIQYAIRAQSFSNFGIEMHETTISNASKAGQADFRDETWMQPLESRSGLLVTIGVPHACLASEVILAEMFDQTPFRCGPSSPPFVFLWDWKNVFKPGAVPSAFSRGPENLPADLKQFNAATLACAANSKMRALAFLDRGHWRISPTQGQTNDGFQSCYPGVLCMQKMRHEWRVVVAGMSGPATCKIAEHILGEKFPSVECASDPETHGTAHERVYWMPFEVETRDFARPGQIGDHRKAVGIKPLCDEFQVFVPKRMSGQAG